MAAGASMARGGAVDRTRFIKADALRRDALEVTDPIRRHLRLVENAQDPSSSIDALDDEVSATRRSVARFLRALQVSGHAIASWPTVLVSRLAHADAVTARYLSEPERVDVAQVRSSCVALRAFVEAMVAGLDPHERARLRSYELAIRVTAEELATPLVQPDRVPEDDAPVELCHRLGGVLRALGV